MNKGECDGVDGLAVLDDHVEAVLVVHDGPQTHDTHMNVIRHVTNFAVFFPFGGFSEFISGEVGFSASDR